jgi:tetratricopeptide (TPR) repeat protein
MGRIILVCVIGGVLAGGCGEERADPPKAASQPTSAATTQNHEAVAAIPLPPAQENSGQSIAALTRMIDAIEQYCRRYDGVDLLAEISRLQTDPDHHADVGRAALRLGDVALAAAAFYEALDLDPMHERALRGLAAALVGAERYAEAVDILEMIVGLSPADRPSRFDLGVVQTRLGRLKPAELTFRHILGSADIDDPLTLKSAYNLAGIYQAQGKLTDARDLWRRITQRAPHLAGAHSQLGEVSMKLGDFEQAMAAYAEAAKRQPKNVSAWLNLATASRAAGSYGRAVIAVRRAAGLAPKDAVVWNRLGELLIELHRETGQREFVVYAIDTWRTSLDCNAEQPGVKKLIETYEAALEKMPDGAE